MIDDEITYFLYKYVINNNPDINPGDISSYKAWNKHDLQINFKDGNSILFDTFANTTRRLHYTNRKISDKQLKLDFKRRLQVIMNRKWVNQEELAKRIGTTQQMISRYLTGQSIPSAITLKRIADALDVGVEELYEPRY